MLQINSKILSRSILLVASFLGFYGLQAQSINTELPLVNSFSFQPLLYNPAAGSLYKLEINGNFRSYLGDFKDANTTYISALYSFKKRTSQNNRAIGALLLNQAGGDFISSSRAYLIYQEQISITKMSWLRFGAQVGAVNIGIESLGYSSGGSSWNADASIGLTAGGKLWSGGFVLHQFLNSVLQPIVYTFDLQNYQEWFAHYTFKLLPTLNYVPMVRYQRIPSNSRFLFSNTWELNEKYGANVTFNFGKGFSVLAFYSMKKYKVFVSYFFPTVSQQKNIDAPQIEIGVTLFTKKLND